MSVTEYNYSLPLLLPFALFAVSFTIELFAVKAKLFPFDFAAIFFTNTVVININTKPGFP